MDSSVGVLAPPGRTRAPNTNAAYWTGTWSPSRSGAGRPCSPTGRAEWPFLAFGPTVQSGQGRCLRGWCAGQPTGQLHNPLQDIDRERLGGDRGEVASLTDHGRTAEEDLEVSIMSARSRGVIRRTGTSTHSPSMSFGSVA
jgi:hypothetical protein